MKQYQKPTITEILDAYKALASIIFQKPVDNITPEERRLTKSNFYLWMYSPNDRMRYIASIRVEL